MASVAKNLQGTGAFLNHIVRLDPAALTYEVIDIPEGMYPPSNLMVCVDSRCFCGIDCSELPVLERWLEQMVYGTKIYKFDCDTPRAIVVYRFGRKKEPLKLYGCAIGCSSCDG